MILITPSGRIERSSIQRKFFPPTHTEQRVKRGGIHLTTIVLAVDGNHRRPIRVGTSEKGCEYEGVRITATSSRRALAKSRARERHTKSSLSYDLIRKGELTNQRMRPHPKIRELGLELGHPQSPSHQLDRDVDIHTQV